MKKKVIICLIALVLLAALVTTIILLNRPPEAVCENPVAYTCNKEIINKRLISFINKTIFFIFLLGNEPLLYLLLKLYIFLLCVKI